MSREAVAKVAGVPIEQVHHTTREHVRNFYAATCPQHLLDAATSARGEGGGPIAFYRVGQRYFVYDPAFFHRPFAIDELSYDNENGLAVQGEF